MRRPRVFFASIGLLFIALAGCSSRPSTPSESSSTGATQASAYTCPMHPAYRSDRPGDCPMCGMRLVPVGAADAAPGGALTNMPGMIHVSADKQQLIGVRIDEVRPAAASRLTLRVPGRVAVDDQRLYRITAAVDGWIRQLGQNPAGTFVRKHEVLATYYAPNLIQAAQTYVFALQTNAQALSGDATIGYQRGTTQLSLQVALDSLRTIGMSERQIKQIEDTRVAPTEVSVYSPIDGFVIARNVSPEQRFDKGTELYLISDIGHVWVLAEIFEKDADYLKPGTRATVLYQNRRLEARMSNALPQFDPQTRTLKTRFDVDNPGNILRPDMFVDVELHVDMPAAVMVPADAVVDSGLRKTVFVERGDGYFEARRVVTGRNVGDRVEILSGLMIGDRIVASGNFLLDSESRMKSAAAGIIDPETDPVCGMEVDRDTAARAGRTVTHAHAAYYFCSDDCKTKFLADPERYTAGDGRDMTPAAGPGRGAPMAGMSVEPPHANPAEGMPAEPAHADPMAGMPAAPKATAQAKDVVCGMSVDPAAAAAAGRKVDYEGRTYFFCSDDCKAKFQANPAAFARPGGGVR